MVCVCWLHTRSFFLDVVFISGLEDQGWMKPALIFGWSLTLEVLLRHSEPRRGRLAVVEQANRK